MVAFVSTSHSSNFAIGNMRLINQKNVIHHILLSATTGNTNGETSSSNNSKPKMKNKTRKSKSPSKITKKLTKSKKVMTESLLPSTELQLGSKIDGHVAAFTSFGVFIKTNYDFKDRGSHGYALLHKSQIRDEPIEDLTKLFRIGAQVKGLRVININYAKGEVGLSLREQRPERMDMKDVPVGKDIEGTVSKVVSYGVFVDVGK